MPKWCNRLNRFIADQFRFRMGILNTSIISTSDDQFNMIINHLLILTLSFVIDAQVNKLNFDLTEPLELEFRISQLTIVVSNMLKSKVLAKIDEGKTRGYR